MRPFRSFAQLTVASAAITLALSVASALAGTPSELSDLVGARGSGGEREMESRGYEYVTMTHGTQYWWNAGSKTCVGIRVAQGRYKSIASAGAERCGKHAGGGSHAHQAKVDFSDLYNGSDMRAQRQLEKRGFVAVDGSQSSSGFSNLWLFNRRTGQCVQIETAEGKVMTINEVKHPKCRWAPAGMASAAFCGPLGPILGNIHAYRCDGSPG
jgi:hypothetical protein